MKVLFLELVPNVGHKWEIKEVSDAYARNFLIPKNLAKKLTPQEEQKLKNDLKKQEEHRRELVENKHIYSQKINWQTIKIKATIWNNWKMFWSIWEKEVIDLVFKNFQIKLEKKHIDMWNDWHIKKLWSRDIFIKFSQDNIAKLIVVVEE